MDLDDFYATVMSDQTDKSPGNHAADFTTHFNPPLKLPKGSYEIGLAEIKLPSSYVKFIPKQPGPIFGSPTSNNDMEVSKKTISFYNVSKNGDTVNQFFVLTSTKLKELKAPITFSLTSELGSSKVFVVLSFDMKDRFLRLISDLASAFGFSETEFLHGEYTAPKEMNNEFFLKIPESATFMLELERWETQSHAIAEPPSRSIGDIALSIAVALLDYRKDLDISFDSQICKIVVKKSKLRIKLPEPLLQVFGLPTDYVIDQPETVLAATYTPLQERSVVEASAVGSLVYVECNVIQPQNIGGHVHNYLRILKSNTNTDEVKRLQPVLYLKPSSEEVNFLRIRLFSTTHANLVAPKEENTIATLHFKKQTI